MGHLNCTRGPARAPIGRSGSGGCYSPPVVWEPETFAAPSADVPPITEVAPGFPVEFDQPGHVGLEWNRDRGHMPEAMAPLAGDYARVIGSTLNSWQGDYGDFPHRYHTGVWHGWVYFAFEPNATPEQWAVVRPRVTALCRELADGTEAWWRDEVVPEVRSLYDRMDAVDAEAAGPEVADAWDASWLATERAWKLHGLACLGPFQILEDLGAAYKVAKPDAPAGEAFRLILGSRHELFEMDLETERLAAMAAAAPAVATALRSGVRSLDELRKLAEGAAFVTAVEAFLERHGHLGQADNDLTLPSWASAPERFLDELTKRLDTSPSASKRQERLQREADELAAAARASLADRPDDLERFDRILDLARRIGPLSEIHNYWIDRAAQAHLHSLVVRVGRRLVRDGVIGASDDIFYVRRTEVADLLRRPTDARPLVSERRALHARQGQIAPAPMVGTPPAAAPDKDQPTSIHAAPTEVDILRGTGASAGVARGTARVVHGASEFDRIMAGDIIVCQASNPSWVPVFTIAGGLVTSLGGVLSHAAVVAREFGLPAVVGVRDAMSAIADGRQVEIDGTAGVVRLL